MQLRVVAASALLVLGACTGTGTVERPPLVYALDVEFGSVAIDGLAAVDLPVRNLSGSDSVLRANLSDPFALQDPGPVLVPADGEVLLRITFQPHTAGEAAGQLLLAFEGSSSPPVAVRLHGRGVAPEIQVEPLRIDFGSVPLGAHTTPYTIAVGNVGEVPSAVTATLEPGGPFYFSRRDPRGRQQLVETFDLPPLYTGTTGRLDLVYKPTEHSPDVAFLRVRACASCAEISVRLEGEGVPAQVVAGVAELDLGGVLVGETSAREIELRGLPPLDLRFDLLELGVEGPAAGAFAIEGVTAPRHVDDGGHLRIPVRFTPGFVGAAAATLVARVEGGTVRVPLVGRGTSSDFVVSPGALSFGLWPAGATATRMIDVDVRGDGAPTVFGSARIEGSSAFRVDLPATPFQLPETGLHVPVSMTAPLAGTFEGTLVLDPGSAGDVQVRIPLQGTAVPSDFCSLWISPGSLRFGLRPAASLTKRVIRLQNAGASACSFGGLEVRGSSAFALQGTPPEVRTLASGESFDVEIVYRTGAPSGVVDQALLRVLQPNRSVPELLVPISGQGAGRLAGSAGVFSPVRVGDAGLSAITLRNDGRAGVRVLGVSLADGARSSFALAGAVPEEVGPESSVSVPIAFRPRYTGARTEELQVLTDAGTEPVIVELSAEGLTGCSGSGCGGIVVTCPGTFSAPAYDWVQLGTAALHSGGKPVECTFRAGTAKTPELIQPHGCDADVILAEAGLYDVWLTARTADGEVKTCKVTVQARPPDGLVVRSRPNPGSADLDLRLLPAEAGDPAQTSSWSSDTVCWGGNPAPAWGSGTSIDDPVFHNGRSGMPDVIRIPEPARAQKLGVGVRWAGGSADKVDALTEIFCAATSGVSEATLAHRYDGSYESEIALDEAGVCKIARKGVALYLP